MSIRPKTIANDLVDDINRLLNLGRLLPAESPQVTYFFDQIKKLDECSPNQARAMRALVYQLCGDVDSAIAECAGMTSEDGRDPELDRLCAFSNLGRAAQGLECFAIHASPESGMFTAAVNAGVSIGAFRTLGQFIKRANSMHLSNMESVPQEALLAAAQILEEHGTEDREIARALDVAGDVFREHGLVYLGSAGMDAFEEQGMVRLCYRLAVTPPQATTLYGEFLERLDDADIPFPAGFVVAFEGAEHQASGMYA